MPLVLNLGSKVRIFREKKGWRELSKILSIADADITLDTENRSVTFQNTHIKPYICPTEDTIINDLEKTIDEEISTIFNHPEIENLYQ